MSRPPRCLACFESILEICIAYIVTKISKSLGTLSRLRHFVPSSTLLNIYRSLIQPYISYRLALWVQAVQSNLILIRSWYYKSVRFASSILHRPNLMLSLLFDLYDVPPLNFLYFKSICIIMDAVFNNKAPLNISSFVTLVSDAHDYNSRFSQADTFAIQNSRTQQRIKSFSCTGIRRGIAFLLIFVRY